MSTGKAEARLLRRAVRRHASQFLAQRVSHREFLTFVRRDAIAAGVIQDRRASADERTLDALAWGAGSIEPGLLPSRLEPLFERFEADELSAVEFSRAVALLISQIRRL